MRLINLREYKRLEATVYTGRPQGEEVRNKLDLDQVDKSDEKIVFVIPEETTSFNPSFYLGLLFKSFKKLGVEKFSVKYSFEVDSENPEVVQTILENISEGERYAKDSLLFNKSIKNMFGW